MEPRSTFRISGSAALTWQPWFAAFALVVGLVAARPAIAAGEASVFFGQRAQSDDIVDAAGIDEVTQLGVMVTLDFEWPVSLALDLLASSDDNAETVSGAFPTVFDSEIETLELDVGVRKFWGQKARPYVGGGLAWVDLDGKQTESGTLGGSVTFTDLIVDDSDSGVGYWIDGGFVYAVRRSLIVGVDVRLTDSKVKLTPEGDVGKLELDSGGTQYGFTIGYHW